MKEVGINKRLYDRRIELGYSVKEACIRLDISKLQLSLIENGYCKVKNKELQKRFIFKYKLEENFFESSELGYPSILDDDKDEDIRESNFVKVFKNIWFKIGIIFFTLGSAAMFTVGITRYASIDAPDYYSEKYIAAEKYAKYNGVKHYIPESKTSEMLLCNYRGIDYEDPTGIDGFTYESLNFFPNYNDYLGYAFFLGKANVDLTEITGINLGPGAIYFESRMTDVSERLHFYAYTYEDTIVPSAHFSVDYDYYNETFHYNLMEVKDPNGKLVKTTDNSINVAVFKFVFESRFKTFEKAKERFIQANKSILHYDSLSEFNKDQSTGLYAYNYFSNVNTVLIILGVVFTTLFFGIFVLSLIVTTKFGKKVIDVVSIEHKDDFVETSQEKKYKELPKNRLPSPILPEAIIRIVAFILMVIGSMSLYYIFNAIMNGDIIGTFESLDHRATVASFSTLGMILIFFIKLDIIQNKKSTFMLNYILFFAGFIFYVMTLLISIEMKSSPALDRFSIILDFLPGNIVWAILAFNLLTSILLSKPKFEKNEKRNTILYRLSALIPFGYMIASCVLQIGKKYGWQVPFAVSSLFFTKALIITGFTILYCVSIYIYRRIIDHKFGKENAEVYVLGNRYQYIKNFIIAVVITVLGLADMLLGKTDYGAKVGFGVNGGIFFLIPLVLLYHPHRGPRNKKWDLVFNIAYGFSLIIGILCIISSIGVYITSL